ncbi:hypothetical protein JCM3774_000348 [Rhodotorula dairenensis]
MDSRVDSIDQSLHAAAPVASTSTSPSSACAGTTPPSGPAQPSKRARKPRIVLQGTADEILARNAASASAAFVDKLVQRAGTHWNRFYTNHAKNPAPFFKDRHWTDREWPQLAQLGNVPAEDDVGGGGAHGPEATGSATEGKGKAVLEVGCGTGAFIYPLLERYPHARYVAFDFAKKAVELTKNHPLYTPTSCHVFQHDLTLPLPDLAEKLARAPPEFGDPVLPGSFDIVSCVFVLSALPPHKQAGAVKTLISLLKPGGWLLFRDYALRDAAQLRFHSLPSASYATEPSLLSPRIPATHPSASSSLDDTAVVAAANDDESDPRPAPLHGFEEESTGTTTTIAAPSTTVVDANLAFYRRGDNTLTYFFTPEEITAFVDSALGAIRNDKGAGDEVDLEGGVEVVEREMENRKEGWGCTRRFVHGSWKRIR